MKITIDTKEDSHEDIKRVVRMLEALLEGHVSAPMDMFGSGSSSPSAQQGPGADLFSIFDDKKDAGSSPSSILINGTSRSPDNDEDLSSMIIPY